MTNHCWQSTPRQLNQFQARCQRGLIVIGPWRMWAGRNVRPRLREGLVSPTILDALENDLETSAAPTVPASAPAAQCSSMVRDCARDHESMELDASIPVIQMAAFQPDSAGEGIARPGVILEVARTFVPSCEHFAFHGVQSSVTVAPANPAAPARVAGVAEVVDMATPRGAARQDWESATSCSETESVVGRPVRRRLTLLSRAVEEQVPDSHEQRVARVRRTMQNEHRANAQQRFAREVEEFFANVVRRVGPIEAEVVEIPRALRRQRWSVLNVPLMWAAAAGDDQCAVMQWLTAKCEQLPPFCFHGEEMSCAEAVRISWNVLRNAMHSWNITSRECLSEWIHNQGFPRPRWGAHFSGRAQERILNFVIARDVRGAVLESLFVHIAMSWCREAEFPVAQSVPQCEAPQSSAVSEWEVLDRIDLEEVFHTRFAVLQGWPAQFRGRFRQAVRVALEARQEAAHGGDAEQECRAWKLFLLLPFLLLRRTTGQGRVGKAELFSRFEKFAAGQWEVLYQEASEATRADKPRVPVELTEVKRAQAACHKVRLGEVSRARQCLTGAALAEGTDHTFRLLQDRRPQVVSRPVPAEVLNFDPERPVQLDRKAFLTSLRSAARGSSPGPGGCTYEHLKVLLDEVDTTELLFEVCCTVAQARVPPEVARALMGARLVALTKPDGGVRGIATGSSLRRLVARTLAKQFTKVFEAECAPFQYALSTRAGTDCVGHMLRAATDADPNLTVLSVDGIGAYDHILRTSMLTRLRNMPGAREILPFVRLSYAQPSEYSWYDESGQRRTVRQAEGGEQGDPMMPLLFSIGIQGALEEVSRSLRPEERLCAFLDDVYLLCLPDRVASLYELLSDALLRMAGIRLHQGKTRTWKNAGIVPEGIEELGEEAWQPDGITILGTPIGTAQYISTKMGERIAREQVLWEAIPRVPDLQCAWQLLLQSANPRANHSMRTMPPSQSVDYCVAHDAGIWETAKSLLQGVPRHEEDEARQLSTLPMRMGGLWLRSAARCAPAAYWASWGDALGMIRERTPEVAADVVRQLEEPGPGNGCVGELKQAASLLDRAGFWWRPSWQALHEGKRPPDFRARDPGEWPHGWQYWASSILDCRFRKMSMLSGRSATCQAHLRSHSGHNSGMALSHAPTTPEYTIPAHLFRVLLLERLRLPLPLTEASCIACYELLDVWGRHRAACPHTGRLKQRAAPVERVLARVCREAGARVKFNAYLRDMNVRVPANDGRQVEVLAQDLPCFGGSQLAVDVTLRSALGRSGEAQPNAAEVDGAVLSQARLDKERKYPELLESGRCRLVVVAIETGGRWSDEAVDFIWQLATAKARESPSFIRHQAALAWERRWTRMLSTVCAVSFAASMTELSASTDRPTDGETPSLAEVLSLDPR